MELKYVVDDEGDLAAPWEQFRTYFMFRGEGDQQVFSVRTFYDRPHQIEAKPQLLESIDDWNRRTLWPKVYSHTHDDGTVRLIGEAQMLIGTGVSLEHFVSRRSAGCAPRSSSTSGSSTARPGEGHRVRRGRGGDSGDSD